MHSFKLFLAAIIITAASTVHAEDLWKGYPNGNTVYNIAFQGNYVWSAAEGSLVRWDRRDGTYKQYTVEDGLLSNRIKTVFIDRDNNLWIGSLSGVQKYDGSIYTNYTLEDSGQESHYVIAIDQAPDGAMWFGIQGGLARFDGTAWTYYTKDTSPIDVDYVEIFAIDKDGIFWFTHVTDNRYNGLARFDGETVTLFTPANSGIVSKYVFDIAVDDDNVKWIGTDQGLQSFDGTAWKEHIRPDYEYRDSIMSIDIDGSGTIWAATMPGLVSGELIHPDETHNILRYDGSSWTVLPVNELLPMPVEGYKNIRVDDNGIPWFVTRNNGQDACTLYSFNESKLSSYVVDGPLSYMFNDIFVDRNNVKWFATSYGLSSFDGTSWKNYLYELAKEEYRYETYNGERFYNPNYISFTNFINSIVEDRDGVLWMATLFGIRSFDGTSWKVYSEVNTDVIPNTCSSFSFAGVDGNNVKYFLSTSGVLVMYDGEKWEANTWLKDNKQSILFMVSGASSACAIDNDNNLWFITPIKSTIYRFDGSEWTVYPLETTGVQGVGMSCIVDCNNVKWFGTNKGFYSFDGNEWKNHSTVVIDGNGIRDMTVDRDNMLWLLNGQKLLSYDGKNTVEYATGLSGITMQFAIDRNGLVWFGGLESATTSGIMSYNKNAAVTAVDSPQALPEAVAIRGNFPNPFNPSTTIEFSLPEAGLTTLAIYSITGQKVRELVSEQFTRGVHTVVWDGRDDRSVSVSSGVYLCRLKMGDQVTAKRMLLIR
ncbi:T9SS type A sorting domain-containing protein [bacterium]|nr:T9SS type A sorting domain-containing protein [bacterium]